MEKKELMIGDLIKYNNQILKFSGKFTRYELLNEKPYTCIRCMWNDNEGLEILLEKVEPIPLTREILKLNGFVSQQKYGLHFYLPHKGFEIFECFDGFGSNVLGYGLTVNKRTIDIDYVHQLQHALRLAGLNELADNFKVKEE